MTLPELIKLISASLIYSSNQKVSRVPFRFTAEGIEIFPLIASSSIR